MSGFFDSFNAFLQAAEAAFGENWILKGNTWPAISIDHQTSSLKTMRGGEIEDEATEVHVREEVFISSGVIEGDIIVVRDNEVIVQAIDRDGDAARTLVCGPAQIDVWK